MRGKGRETEREKRSKAGRIKETEGGLPIGG
jgi:hypothetical protein